MIRVGVIGYGYWGPKLARNFAETRGACLAAVCDVAPDRLTPVKSRYPTVQVTTDPKDVLESPHIDAVAISTPVATHFELAMKALAAGKHVFVEKPLTTTAEGAMRLIDLAEQRNLVLMVDHTFVYTGAVRKIRELTATNSLGELYYYDSVRVNLGLFQSDVDVIWDLAVHDIAIMDYVLDARPCAVSATGMTHIPGRKENIAYITVFFDSHLIAHINVNWLSPVKVRRTLIGGSRQMIVYDDMESSEKVKVYDRGVTIDNSVETVHQALVSYRLGDMWAPRLDITEALSIEAQHFVDSIEQGTRPITDGRTGLQVVRILEAATESMRTRGRLAPLVSPQR